MKGYTFNLPLEEDILIMQKLHDRCDTNIFLVHFQPEGWSKCTFTQSITGFRYSARNCNYFKENKLSFASEKTHKSYLNKRLHYKFLRP